MAMNYVRAPLFWEIVTGVPRPGGYQIWSMGPGEYQGGVWKLLHTGSTWVVIRVGEFGTGADMKFHATAYLIDLRETPDAVIDYALLQAGILRGPNGDLHYVKWGLALAPVPGGMICRWPGASRVIVASMAASSMGVWLHSCGGPSAQSVFDVAQDQVDVYLRDPVTLEAHLESKYSHSGTTHREAAAGYSVDRSGWGLSHIKPLGRPARPPCPLGVTHPGHYWQDGSCRCDDHMHHEVMGQLGWKTFDASKLPPRKKFYPRLGPLDCITSTVPS
jgi:hypothetical protein